MSAVPQSHSLNVMFEYCIQMPDKVMFEGLYADALEADVRAAQADPS